MKKIAIALFAIAAFAQSSFAGWSTKAPLNQVSIMRGCNADAGKAFLWITQGTSTYIANTTQPDYLQLNALANAAIASKAPAQVMSTWTAPAINIINQNGVCTVFGTGLITLDGLSVYTAP